MVSVTDNLDPTAKWLSSADAAYPSSAIEKPFRWTQIDESQASALMNRMASDGTDFNAATMYGDRTVRIMYVGPYSPELERPEFQAMYGQTVAGNIGGH